MSPRPAAAGGALTSERQPRFAVRRPLLVRMYGAFHRDAGALGFEARRRAVRFALRSVPALVAVGSSALLALGAFSDLALGWPQACAAGVLLATLAAVLWRRARYAGEGKPATAREHLEIGSLFIVAAHAIAQTSGVLPGDGLLYPVVYLVLAFLVAFLTPAVGLGVAAFAIALDAAAWWSRGAPDAEWPVLAAHGAFIVGFALLFHAVLAARVAASRLAERSAVERRLREIEDRAREFRLLAPAAGEGDGAERERRFAEASVLEVEAAVRSALELAEVALRSHTCAVYLLSDDDELLLLRECRSQSDALRRSLGAGEGPLAGAVKRRAPVRLHGPIRAVGYYDDGTLPRALLVVPLVEGRGHVRGIVVADRLEDAPFSDEDERLLGMLGAEILRAIAAERLMCDMKRTRDEKERFYAAIERLNRTAKLRDVFDAALDVARGMVPLDFAAITLLEPGEGKTVHRVARVLMPEGGKAPLALEGLVFPDNTGLVASAVRLGSSLPGKDLNPGEAVVFDAGTRLKGLRALKVVPLKASDSTLGTLVLGSRREGAFDAETVRQLEVIAMQAGDAVLRARLFEQAERLATTDGLTGLLNHRTFQARLDEQIALSLRYRKRLSLILCDIDHFKSVNDTYGHPAGDKVLKGVARTLVREARATDVVARYGGEEFAIVMPETDGAGALVIAERIREKVAGLIFETELGRLRVTLSLGVATCPEDARQKGALIELADGCLYQAKRGGRNRSTSSARPPVARRAAG